jgi:PleD family two-component response regulator
VINRADKALYHAKETGRNTIVVYEEAFPPPGK